VTEAHVATRPAERVDAGIGTRPWGLSEAERAEVLRALRFRFFKWDTYGGGGCLILPETMVLGRALHEEVVGAAEALHRALGRYEARVRGDRALLRLLSIDDALHPLIEGEEEHPLEFARYDFFPTEDGRLLVSEFNEDVPGGFNEAHLPELLGTPGAGLGWEGDLRRSLVTAFDGYDSVALLYATAFAEDLQHMLIIERWLTQAGHRTVLASPAHLRRGFRRPRVLGRAIDAAFRFYPGEWMPRLPNLATWLRAGLRLPMMNPFRHLIRQSKTMFAFWRDDPGVDEADRALIARYCPRTEPFDPERIPRLIEERERWVVKGAFGRMGDSVVIGSLASAAEWAGALGHAARRPREYCIQERFVVRPLAFETGPLYPAIGVFLVNGRFAGYYSRAAARPLITHEAYHVATLVRGA
jgi:glutathionylspermidine synthase